MLEKGLTTRTLPASLLELSTSAFRIAIPSSLEVGAQVRIRLGNGEVLSGILRFCDEIEGNEYHATIQFDTVAVETERRQEPRISVCHPARFSVIGAEPGNELKVTITNMSRSGLGVRAPIPVNRGTAVEVQLLKHIVFGIVRHCRLRAGAYQVGVVITDMLPSHEQGEPGVSRIRNQIRELARNLRFETRLLPAKSRCWFEDPGLELTATTGQKCPRFAEHHSGEPTGMNFSCQICEAVERWTADQRGLVLCREILGGRGLYLMAIDSTQPPPGNYLLQIRFADLTPLDARTTLQTILSSAEQTWISLPDRSVRIR